VSRTGLLPLAPSFDTVGWLTRDADTLSRAAGATLDLEAQGAVTPDYVFSPALLALCTPGVQAAFASVIARPLDAGPMIAEPVDFGDLDELFESFRMTQAVEAWQSDGAWVDAHPGALGDDIAARFAFAKAITEQQGLEAAAAFAAARERLDAVLGDRVLLLPSASTAAPSSTASAEELETFRANTLRLTCIAGLTGRPGLSVPALHTPLGPVGLCLVGPRYSDLALIELGRALLSAP
jgi:Asp-tRNA(Asn)/Glu-tRNA(Gln) amidotransferase A subunit family amidase